MFYKKQGFPKEGEIVVCTVKKVSPHSIFANLDEYNKEGMIHISEVSPGRIRNIRDYVKEDKRIVCKILRINKEKGYIDLSLRRVSQTLRINKLTEYKQEEKAEKLLESIAKILKKDLKNLYEEIGYKMIEECGSLTNCFQKIVSNKINLEEWDITKKTAQIITDIVKEKIKPKKVIISGILKIQSYAPNGIEIIKEGLNKIKSKNINIDYISAPRYRLVATAEDYKSAENNIKEIIEKLKEYMKNQKEAIEFVRDGQRNI